NELLRNDLGFDGIIITDDLIMGAVTNHMSESEIAVAAVKAGNDMLCTGDYATQIKAVIKAVNRGEISEERIETSVMRILKLKLELGIIS
ncbi:MAG: beta-hexosaminidase, partial [Firmicutes bacterium]|nr:beta-hexosaminidase [Bacillota bacterium]